MSEYILEMNHIEKSFLGVHALKGVSLKVKRGTVHALLGENGAGKSTLMKILMGMYRQDAGEVLFEGKKLQAAGMGDILKQGISMIYQELNPLPDMRVAENIYLGREPKKRLGLVDYKALFRNTEELFQYLGISNLSPAEKMSSLTTAKMQLVEIAKAISYHSRLIVMDEPTSSLTENECRHLFEIVDMLKREGIAFIFISHKLEEIFRIADEATILRDGEWIGSGPVNSMDKDDMIKMMVGREVRQLYPKMNSEIGEVVLRAEHMSRDREFEDVSFEARRGEIVGFAGLVGAGRSELMETVFGYRRREQGEIYVNGEKVSIKTPADAIRHRMALLTEDRKHTGLFLSLSVKDNMAMPSLARYQKGPFLNHKKILEACARQKDNFLLKTDSFKQTVNHLSGGNQQKILVSRWLLTDPDIIILDEPTRGIDIGAKSDIHRFISNLAAQGKCILMISSELPEILGMSDRIYVMHEGRMTGCIDRQAATQESILQMATGEADRIQEGEQ